MPDVSPSPWGTGRSLYEIPPVMIAAARERSMVLIELCAVVPFERMIEDFHELLVRQRMGTVRAAEPVWQELMGTVLQEKWSSKEGQATQGGQFAELQAQLQQLMQSGAMDASVRMNTMRERLNGMI